MEKLSVDKANKLTAELANLAKEDQSNTPYFKEKLEKLSRHWQEEDRRRIEIWQVFARLARLQNYNLEAIWQHVDLGTRQSGQSDQANNLATLLSVKLFEQPRRASTVCKHLCGLGVFSCCPIA